jgi:PAS domain S-box-containing protein
MVFIMRPTTTASWLAARVAAVFLVVGAAWIFISDIALYRLTQDRALIGRIETAKGWAFVIVVALVLYGVTKASAARVVRSLVTLSAVLCGIGDGVLILGPGRTVIFANPAAVRLLGADEEELIGMDAAVFSRTFRVSYPDGRIVPPERFASQRVFDEPGPIEYRAVIHRRDGSTLFVVVTAAAIREQSDGPTQMVVSVIHDTTAQETFERMRDDLFAAVAHALRTPVAVIKGNAELLAEGGLGRLSRATAAIDRQCGRIERLIENLLVVARARSGSFRLHPVELELSPLVEEVVAEMQRAAMRHSLRAEIGGTPRVFGDRERLATALRDLIEGALRSSAQGTPVIVSLAQHEGDVELGVRYEPGVADGSRSSYAEYDDVGTARYAVDVIVGAHGGTVARRMKANEVVETMHLPASA